MFTIIPQLKSNGRLSIKFISKAWSSKYATIYTAENKEPPYNAERTLYSEMKSNIFGPLRRSREA